MPTSSSRAPYLRLVSDADHFEVGDGSLGRALARRERWAAAAAWKRFAPRVFSLILQALVRVGDSEELTQEVMLHALSEASSKQRPLSFTALVYRHAARVIEREFRRDNRRRRFWRKPRISTLELVGVSDHTERAALLRLYDVLEQLSASERTLFVLAEFADLSELDIAEALQLSLSKLRKRLFRTMAKVEGLVDCDPVLAAYLCDTRTPERDLREGA